MAGMSRTSVGLTKDVWNKKIELLFVKRDN